MTAKPDEALITESRNPASLQLDQLGSLQVVQLMNQQDAGVAAAVAAAAAPIAAAIDLIAARLRRGGRLVYIGAGTSGRLGVLDAAECPPTFNTAPGQVLGLIAGGPGALQRSVEGAEDRADTARQQLEAIHLGPEDVLVGISASGRTPYAIAGLEHARSVGAATVSISCNAGSALAATAEVAIEAVVGPEILAGSTRLKAGTATKMVLNMLSTGAMVQLGKTHSNLMVDLQASNDKLVQRSCKILCDITGIDEESARARLAACDGDLKTAAVAEALGLSPAAARERLAACDGILRRALRP